MAVCARRLSQRFVSALRTGERCGSRQFFSRSEGSKTDSAKTTPWKWLGTMAGSGFAGGILLSGQVAFAEFDLHPPKLPWYHKQSLTHSLDHESMRRGFQVYSQVCSACHSLEYIHWRDLIDVTHTEEEVKEMAKNHMYIDGPDENAQMFERPGKPGDLLPKPYKNEAEARVANNGALPPDLSLIVFGREGEEDYIFHLLTGYCDPPTGVSIPEDQHYHPYFPGQSIGMAKALYEGVMEYEDGTPATTSQMAKDVTTFLTWCNEPSHDDRKRAGFKVWAILAVFGGVFFYMNRQKWSVLKTQKALYTQLPKRK